MSKYYKLKEKSNQQRMIMKLKHVFIVVWDVNLS